VHELSGISKHLPPVIALGPDGHPLPVEAAVRVAGEGAPSSHTNCVDVIPVGVGGSEPTESHFPLWYDKPPSTVARGRVVSNGASCCGHILAHCRLVRSSPIWASDNNSLTRWSKGESLLRSCHRRWRRGLNVIAVCINVSAERFSHLSLRSRLRINVPKQTVLQTLLHSFSPSKGSSIYKVDSALLSSLSSGDSRKNPSRGGSVVCERRTVNVHVELTLALLGVPTHVPSTLTGARLAGHRDVQVADEVHVHCRAARRAHTALEWIKGGKSRCVVRNLSPVRLALTEPPACAGVAFTESPFTV